jgi:hypothetical protein
MRPDRSQTISTSVMAATTLSMNWRASSSSAFFCSSSTWD